MSYAQDTRGALPELVPDPLGKGLILAHAKESLTELSLKDSELKADVPLLGSKEQGKSFVRELWQVRWRPNDPIDLYVIRPLNVDRPPVVLYLYGYPSETDRFKDDAFCERVVHSGAAAVGFVSAWTGHRADHRPPTQTFISQLPEALATTVHDVQMIVNYLESRTDLDAKRIGIFGQGSGGAIAILAATADSRLKAVDVLDTWGDWPDWLAKADGIPNQERANYLKPEFLKQLEPLEPLKYLPTLNTRLRMQFIIENGEPADAVEKLKAAAPAKTPVVVFPTGRAMWNVSSDGRLFEWLATELKPSAQQNSGQAPNTSSTVAQR